MKVSETFVSLQGEGLNQGKPCFFLRLAGCNLRCAWCDTEYSFEKGEEKSVDEIVKEISESGLSYVCITGGEPLLQKKELLPLLEILSAAKISVDIETNGTIPFSELNRFASICMDVKCPSSCEVSDLSLLSSLQKSDCVKFVIGDEADYMYMVEVLASAEDLKAQVCITPVYGTETKWLVETIISEKLPVRFQLQLHKELDVK
ncbi:MAG: radical SAM protein [Methanocorpusculum sp.]|nr:radical SAM protein [Methanocorpusculum sp.]